MKPIRRSTLVVALALAGPLVALVPACTDQGGQGGPKPVKPVREELPAPPPRSNVAVDPALKESARRELAAALAHADPVVRAHAVEGYREAMGSGAREQLASALSDKEPMVRFAACMAIGELRIEELKARVEPLLKDKSPHVQVGAVFALHRLRDYRYSSVLEENLLSNPDPGVRGNAALAMGRTGTPSAAKVLRRAMKDPAVEVRLQAAEGVWRLDQGEDALKILVPAGLSGNPAHQMVGVMALAGAGDRRIIEHVRGGLDSGYVEVKLVTARALAMLGSDEAYTVAADATRSAEARHRYLAALALGAIGRADAQATLAPLLKDVDPNVRVAAATAILQLR